MRRLGLLIASCVLILLMLIPLLFMGFGSIALFMQNPPPAVVFLGIVQEMYVLIFLCANKYALKRKLIFDWLPRVSIVGASGLCCSLLFNNDWRREGDWFLPIFAIVVSGALPIHVLLQRKLVLQSDTRTHE